MMKRITYSSIRTAAPAQLPATCPPLEFLMRIRAGRRPHRPISGADSMLVAAATRLALRSR